jgi:hypothetical protein
MAVEATIWAILFAMIFDALQFGGNQVVIQRMLATGSGRKTYKAVISGAFINFIWVLFTIATTASPGLTVMAQNLHFTVCSNNVGTDWGVAIPAGVDTPQRPSAGSVCKKG